MKAFFLVVGSGALVLGSAASAAVPPPSLPSALVDGAPGPSSTHGRVPPAPGVTLGRLPIRFEQTTLAQVAAAVGTGTVSQQGDASESATWLCYTVEHRYRAWLTSSEMGGGEYIDGLVLQASPKAFATAACPALPASFQPVALTNGLGLDTTLPRLAHLLGPASRVVGAWRAYDYQVNVPPIEKCPPSGYDLDNHVVVKLKAGRVSVLSAGQVSSC